MNTLSNSVLAEVSVLPDPAAIQPQRNRQEAYINYILVSLLAQALY